MANSNCSNTTNPTTKTQAVDPSEPFIARDGLEYEDLAAYILSRPVSCWRNDRIREHRAQGHSEEALQAWIRAYDGENPVLSHKLDTTERLERLVRANFAVSPLGTPPGTPNYLTPHFVERPSSARTGPAGAGQAPADPVHAAADAEVRRRVGA